MGIDPKWTTYLGVLVTVEMAIGNGSVSLTNVVPHEWAPYVQGWCNLLGFIGTTAMTAMSAFSSNKPGPLTGGQK